ncbi:hypothetical protein IE53DRAFT_257634 [Violaceomyces palustris]|uniref:Uncharacterized protein n=1 Tax=Violaceomyces palustris TaxID=1673888 RepID=A0ACD0NNB7_9BASI|nr:hypothetical protein IE53DRAFT_257634 [Violaceomyces palustris]
MTMNVARTAAPFGNRLTLLADSVGCFPRCNRCNSFSKEGPLSLSLSLSLTFVFIFNILFPPECVLVVHFPLILVFLFLSFLRRETQRFYHDRYQRASEV